MIIHHRCPITIISKLIRNIVNINCIHVNSDNNTRFSNELHKCCYVKLYLYYKRCRLLPSRVIETWFVKLENLIYHVDPFSISEIYIFALLARSLFSISLSKKKKKREETRVGSINNFVQRAKNISLRSADCYRPTLYSSIVLPSPFERRIQRINSTARWIHPSWISSHNGVPSDTWWIEQKKILLFRDSRLRYLALLFFIIIIIREIIKSHEKYSKRVVRLVALNIKNRRGFRGEFIDFR